MALRVLCVAKFYCVSIADCSVKHVNLSFNGVLHIYFSLICVLCILLSVNQSEVWHDFVDTLYIIQKLALLCTFLEKQLNEMETKEIVTCDAVLECHIFFLYHQVLTCKNLSGHIIYSCSVDMYLPKRIRYILGFQCFVSYLLVFKLYCILF